MSTKEIEVELIIPRRLLRDTDSWRRPWRGNIYVRHGFFFGVIVGNLAWLIGVEIAAGLWWLLR